MSGPSERWPGSISLVARASGANQGLERLGTHLAISLELLLLLNAAHGERRRRPEIAVDRDVKRMLCEPLLHQSAVGARGPNCHEAPREERNPPGDLGAPLTSSR
jgi:hypothetical protein